jgi:hypothetical protein
MRVRVWQAFASNNSGSYTLVGRFKREDEAREVAEALAALAQAQGAWIEGNDVSALASPGWDWEASPLAAFHRAHGLPWTPRSGYFDDWPGDGAPTVIALGHQVIVHAPYTVTLIPTFAQFIVMRAGRVQTELDHSHAPLVCAIECWWKHDQPDKPVEAVRAEVEASPAFVQARTIEWKPDQLKPFLWRPGDHWMEPPVLLAAVFEDLIAGVACVDAIVKRHGGQTILRVVEAENHHEPLAAFERRCRLVIDDVGPRPGEVAAVLVRHFALSAVEAHALVKQAPVVLGEWPEGRARELEVQLGAAGASVVALPVPVPKD